METTAPDVPATAEEILNPDREVRIRAGRETVLVRELDWRTTSRLVQRLNGEIESRLKVVSLRDGQVSFETKGLVGLLVSQFPEDIVAGACGKDVDWAGALPNSDFLRVLDAAVALNLSPRVIEAGKALAGRFMAMMLPAIQAVVASGQFTPSSSPRDIPAGT